MENLYQCLKVTLKYHIFIASILFVKWHNNRGKQDELDSIFKLTNCKKIFENNIISTKSYLISY